jgi:Stress responsive A/B Barrel Domain
MIRHVVLFKLRKDLDESTSAQIFAALKALQHQMPGILTVSAGKDISPEGLQRRRTRCLLAASSAPESRPNDCSCHNRRH